MTRPRSRGERGFTLLELLIALGIFSLVAIMAFSGFRSVQSTSSHMKGVASELARLQMVFGIIGRDVQQSVARSIRDDFGDTQPALIGAGSGFGKMLEFTRGGWVNPLGQQRSSLQRVAYGIKENNLVRMSWPMLDRVQGVEPRESVLLEEVKAFGLRFMKPDNRQWVSDWPPLTTGESAPPSLPMAVEVTIELEGWGKLIRLYSLATGEANVPAPAVPAT